VLFIFGSVAVEFGLKQCVNGAIYKEWRAGRPLDFKPGFQPEAARALHK
jgi:hypothetical protein